MGPSRSRVCRGELLHLGRVRGVGGLDLNRQPFLGERLLQTQQTLLAARRGHDVRALAGKQYRGLAANAARSANDEYHLVL